MEGQRIADNLRVCSRCHIIKSTADFYRCGAISKKTGLRYLSSLCKPCHQQATHVVNRRRAEAKKNRHRGQQVILREGIVGQSLLVVQLTAELVAEAEAEYARLVDYKFEAAYDSDLALAE